MRRLLPLVLFALFGCPAAPPPIPLEKDATVDAGSIDAAADTGVDVGVDAGELDTGGVPDTGDIPDSGGPPPDGGPPPACPDGVEGCRCGPGGLCNDPGVGCVELSDPSAAIQDRLFVCIRNCSDDGQCVASTVGNSLCRPIFAAELGCVTATVAEGSTTDVSRLRGVPMTGCQVGNVAIPQRTGLEIEEDQASCAEPCDSSMDGDCGGQRHCIPGVINLGLRDGICTERRFGPGDVCSQSAINYVCDPTVPNLRCIGIPYDFGPIPDAGMCMQLCDLTSPDCTASDDPTVGPATCAQITATSTAVGVCSNDCSLFPSQCGRPGAYGVGTTCTRDLFFEMGYPVSFCLNVLTPTIAEYDFMSNPTMGCQTATAGAVRCTAGTFCANNSNGGGVCVRGCDPSSPGATGCEGTGATTCDDGALLPDGDNQGACRP